MGIFKAYDIRGIYGEEFGQKETYRMVATHKTVSTNKLK